MSSPVVIQYLTGQDCNPLLCSVRALKIYLNRVLPRRKKRRRTFISHLESSDKEISADSISRCIVQTIKFAYESKNLDMSKVNAHDVRAWSSSWAWSNKIPLVDNVIKASVWSSENLLIRFYLRDNSGIVRSLADLGPLIAAQQVVVPATSNQ